MKNIFKLSRKLVLLLVMLVCLGFVISTNIGTTEIGAAPCCSQCEAQENYCYELPPGPEQDQCYTWVIRCWRWCSFSC